MHDEFDRFLRYDELVAWLHEVAEAHPDLMTLETYGRSHEGRDLWLATITETASGSHDTKPAHWVDANIHAVELTAGVAACFLIHRLVTGHADGDPAVVRALRTRTFYIVPRVNPDGVEWALADHPRFRRSSTRPWPWTDGHRLPGHVIEDIDGDGRILEMRIPDRRGGWMPHPDDERLLVPVPAAGAPVGVATYRLLQEGSVADYDGFTIPTPRPPEGLDLNRNYPAGWGTGVAGSGDHPLSEPEIDALVRAISARPNVCGFNAYHTSGGVLLRPSSTQSDGDLPPFDVWAWKELAARGTELTGYPAHSVYEDFTWDRTDLLSGASDDWAYEHLGVFGWTTEFWDVVHAATGSKQSTHFWYTGPTDDEALAVLRWCDEHHPDGYVDWRSFEHPQLGPVEIGGWDALSTWINPPPNLLRDEVAAHADFAVHQALCAPQLEIVGVSSEPLGDGTHRLDVRLANVGFFATDVSQRARKQQLGTPIVVQLEGVDANDVLDGPLRRRLGVEAPGPASGQLEGRAALRFRSGNDGTPDRALVRFIVRGSPGQILTVHAVHDRSGRCSVDHAI